MCSQATPHWERSGGRSSIKKEEPLTDAVLDDANDDLQYLFETPSCLEATVGIRRQSVSFTNAAYAYARALVEQGDYPTLSAAVSGELARARTSHDRALLEAEARRRLEVPLNQWVPVGDADDLTRGALARIDALEREAGQ